MAPAHGHRHRTQLVHKVQKTVGDVRADINVTPLVDVCLVLLIIFMVVAEKLVRGMEVNLPKTRHHEKRKDTGEQLIISAMKEGGRVYYYWDRDRLRGLPDLKEKLTEEFRRGPRPVFVKGDAESLVYKDVYPLLITIHEAGTQSVQLGTAEMVEGSQ